MLLVLVMIKLLRSYVVSPFRGISSLRPLYTFRSCLSFYRYFSFFPLAFKHSFRFLVRICIFSNSGFHRFI